MISMGRLWNRCAIGALCMQRLALVNEDDDQPYGVGWKGDVVACMVEAMES